jgi:hypothetical protein
MRDSKYPTRAFFINLFQQTALIPSGAKAHISPALHGAAEAAPLQSAIYETRSTEWELKLLFVQ